MSIRITREFLKWRIENMSHSVGATFDALMYLDGIDISYVKLAKIIGLSERQVQRNIHKLVKFGLLRIHGKKYELSMEPKKQKPSFNVDRIIEEEINLE